MSKTASIRSGWDLVAGTVQDVSSNFVIAGGRVGSVVARRAIDLKVRGSSPANGGSRIAG